MQNIKFSADIRSTRLPFVSITEGTFKGLNFLVYTGCTESILFAKAAEKFENELRTKGEYGSVCGLDATTHKTIVVFGDMIFGGKQTTVTFNLFDEDNSLEEFEQRLGFPMHGILGTDFMLASGWIVDIIHQCIIVVSDEQSLVA